MAHDINAVLDLDIWAFMDYNKRGIRMEYLISAIIDIVINIGTDFFKGIKGKIRLYKLKKRLKCEITAKIMNRYGNEVYYNDLDQFLTKNNVICNLIQNCLNSPVFEYQSQADSIDYYEQLFLEEHPNFSINRTDIKTIIQRYFEVIFNTLNPIEDESTRAVCNVAKELGKSISSELADIKKALSEIDRKVSESKTEQIEDVSFDYNGYLSYLLSLSTKIVKGKHLSRAIYNKCDDENNYEAIEALLNEREILLIGEAGFGKTFESMALLRKICDDKRAQQLIPIFLPLYEYGLLYDTIRAGIISKINLFGKGNIELLVDSFLKDGKFIFILDGIDDITSEGNRAKFFADANDFLIKYSNNYFFVTSRFNRYHGELVIDKEYRLTPLNEMTVHFELQTAGITTTIPKSYYNLFQNPYFLSIGKKVLKGNRNKNIFNRSQLFLELFQNLYIGINQKKCGVRSQIVTCSDALTILGKIAFDTFTQPTYGIIEFDKKLTELSSTNSSGVIASFISSGLLKVTDRVTFTHKLLKEFCAAYHLVNNYTITEHHDLYCKLIQDEEWKEVFTFASGLFSDSEKQDVFLDFVMGSNLQLYVECVNSKVDLVNSDSLLNIECARRILSQIYYSYTYVVDTYFSPIADLFDPLTASKFPGKKIGIFGCLSKDEKHLSYWFDLIDNSESEVNCIADNRLSNKRQEFREKAVHERRNVSYYGINLELSGLNKESGRFIAIDLIKRRLKEITDKKLLMESRFLLCERLSCIKKDVKLIKDLETIQEISDEVDKMINEALSENPDIISYQYGNRIELFDLQAMLHYLCESNVNYSECILPDYDQSINGKGGFIWDLFSDEQKKKRIQKFFYFHQISYLEMMKNNFPKLYRMCSRVLDAPYQNVIHLKFKYNREGWFSDPTIVYYYIASSDVKVPMPLVIEEKEEAHLSQISSSAFKDNQRSFTRLGKISHMSGVTETGFTFTVINSRNGERNPLSEYVYKTIRESLEEIFGELS